MINDSDMDSKILIAVSTCTEVPTVGWMCLKRTHARCHYSGAMTGDQLVVRGSCDSVARRMIFRNVDATLPLTIRLITIRATDEPAS